MNGSKEKEEKMICLAKAQKLSEKRKPINTSPGLCKGCRGINKSLQSLNAGTLSRDLGDLSDTSLIPRYSPVTLKFQP